ncbi:hypothetical protein HC256_005406 [Beauveria bassiana]|nr:hypothetical protein HC256_005406 [Beauveria bassiana]
MFLLWGGIFLSASHERQNDPYATYLDGGIDAEVDEGTFGKHLEYLALAAIETTVVERLVRKNVCLLRRRGIGRVSGERGLIVATAVRDLASTATVAGPFTITLS